MGLTAFYAACATVASSAAIVVRRAESKEYFAGTARNELSVCHR